MSRSFLPLVGSGVGNQFADGDLFTLTQAQRLKDTLDLLMLGVLGRNQYMGGDRVVLAGSGEAGGDYDLGNAIPFTLDNSNSQISGSANVVVQVRYFLRVSNAGITLTPKIYDLTAAGAATIAGAAACAATGSAYTGTNQQQTIALTLPAGVHTFIPRVTVGGTPAVGYEWWALALVDVYISS